MLAISKANASEAMGDARVVLIPNHKYYSMPIVIDHVSDIVIEIRGRLAACNRIKHYPRS